MTTEIVISKSKNKNKKFDVRIDGKKTISFGATGYEDFTTHKDPERKQRYLKRHSKNENPNDHRTASFYATNIFSGNFINIYNRVFLWAKRGRKLKLSFSWQNLF